MNKKLIFTTASRFILALIFFGSSLFLTAGSLYYRNAWLFLGVFLIPMLFYYVYLYVENPAFLEKRLKTRVSEQTEKYFQFLTPLSVITTFLTAGFDYRYHWSIVPDSWTLVFALIALGGNIMYLTAMHQNSYASQVVEIQKGQKLIDTGLYSVVRHPMYLANCIIFCFAPLVLGSLVALIPASFFLIMIVIRIMNEEKVLSKGLEGYDLYMKKVKYRLIPFIW